MNPIKATTIGKSTESARAEAAAWIARLHGPQRSPELEAGLHRWLAEDPHNARAFERMTEAWDDATSLATGHFPRARVWKPSTPKLWTRAAAVLIACGVAAFAARLWWDDSSYTTDIGEQRTVRLEDGSRVSLNSASRIVLDYRESARHMRLEKGEAFFEVAPNPRRPFIVSAGERQVTALGTSFVIRYESDTTAVTLVEGKVIVSPLSSSPLEDPPPAATRAPVAVNSSPASAGSEQKGGVSTATRGEVFTLFPGERLTFAKRELPKLDTPRVEAVTAWRRGEVVLEKTGLADAIAEMNRYDKPRLIIDDASIASLLVSGIYRTGDSVGFARAVAAVHGIAVVQDGDSIHLREGKPGEALAER